MSGSERTADEGREADAPRPRRGLDALALGAFVALALAGVFVGELTPQRHAR